MTARARITQTDMTRAMMAAKVADFEHTRIIMDFANGKIEILVGEAGSHAAEPEEENPLDRILGLK